MKQTAVEYLFYKLWDTPKDKLNWYAILNKAKEIEKKQIIEAWDKACEDENRIGKEYYIDTYETDRS